MKRINPPRKSVGSEDVGLRESFMSNDGLVRIPTQASEPGRAGEEDSQRSSGMVNDMEGIYV